MIPASRVPYSLLWKDQEIQDRAMSWNGMVEIRGPERCTMRFWSCLPCRFFPDCDMGQKRNWPPFFHIRVRDVWPLLEPYLIS